MSAPSNDATSFSLLQRARCDDHDAWSQLVHLYGPLVERWCKRSGLSDDDTADVFQETFRTVSTSLNSFAPRRATGSFRSWLRTIVRTRIIDHHRMQSRHSAGQGGTDAQRLLANIADPLCDVEGSQAESEAEERSLVVHRAMQLIKPEFSAQNWNAFEEVALKGRSAAEVAAELNVNPQTIRQANYRIRRRLRLILEDLSE